MPDVTANAWLRTPQSQPRVHHHPVQHGASLARRGMLSSPPAPHFNGPVDQVVLSTAAKTAATQSSSFLRQAARFLFSKETFYRFWTELAGSAVAGSFILLANSKRWRA